MAFKFFQPVYYKRIFFVVVCMLSLAAKSIPEEVLVEKHVRVAMRMIGHEVLVSLGDCESRIMPIEKIGERYKIAFEIEFGFDPGDIVSILDRVMTENSIASGYLVEVEQCETNEVVHSFEIGNAVNPGLIPCRGRILPEDCYSLFITILDNNWPIANLPASTFDHSSIDTDPPAEALLSDDLASTPLTSKRGYPFKIAYLMVSLLFLIGLTGFLIGKKSPWLPDRAAADSDPDLILIGASRFDKRNMALSFESKRVALSNKEAELLSLLHSYANAPLEREVILQRVWGDDGDYVGRTLDVFISKLRKKLEADASVKIVNIRGVGYKLVMDVPG